MREIAACSRCGYEVIPGPGWSNKTSLCQVCEKDSKPSGTDLRRESLREVEACVCKDRQNTYGDAEDNFAHIAAIANVALADRLKSPLTALDVAVFSCCIKLARIRSSPKHLDNFTDLAGYAVCGAGIVKREQLCESSSVASSGSSASQPVPSKTSGDGAIGSDDPSLSAALSVASVISTP